MKLTRLDLDGTSSPLGLVGKILAAEPNLKIPVPIKKLCQCLDINEFEEVETSAFLGGLITDPERSTGGILLQKGLGSHRRRFTIAHELGHFLIPFHKPAKDGQFLCDTKAMRSWDHKSQNRYLKMEAEANRFAATMLVPPPHLRKFLSQFSTPTLDAVLAVHDKFQVSKEAAARSYCELYGELIAIVIVRHGKVCRSYKHRDFPWIIVGKGQAVPDASRYHSHLGDKISPIMPSGAENWIDTEFGKKIPFMREQILPQVNGFAMIMLWLEENEDDYDPDEDRTAKQRLQHRTARYNG